MKHIFCLAGLLMCLTMGSVFAEEPKTDGSKDVAVRLAFDPKAPARKGDNSRGSMTSMEKGGPAGPDVYWMQANAGVGDSFYVSGDGVKKMFEVKVVKGDDDHLEFEIANNPKNIEFQVKRDQTVEQEVGGQKFKFMFPTVKINGKLGDKPSSPNAMIFVERNP